MSDMLLFGSGKAFVVDGAGVSHEAGQVKDITVEFASTLKEFYGPNRFAIASAVAEEKISGKIGSGVFNMKLLAALLGLTPTTGSKVVASEFTTSATLTVAHSATFTDDLGVAFAATGSLGRPVDLVLAASAPTAGQYSVAAGVYTFNAADVGTKFIDYKYSLTTGSTIALTNRPQGAAPALQLVLDETDGETGLHFGLKLFKVVISKFSIDPKMGDWSGQGLDYAAQADSGGNVFELYGI